ncbi:hypothetical protein CERZMDRAFT_98551 [Cercospora zeae-maydis SCOH1-5]|uniref:Uncharacterized protein n=1 Tax=Cercospora zeae-maydis SCOH1-5 TaxID=717836 RepID=A0A6A6FCV5_9PEZI|nr:hypothetical protein CERZMDRAFT_98551 [Cercospora zeae-maydis SCOH1-5]
MSTLYLTPIPLAPGSTINSTTSFPHPTPQPPASTTPTLATATSAAMFSTGSHQPHVNTMLLASCLLIAYCIVSAILLYGLWSTGFIDCKLNLDPSPYVRRDRLRRHMNWRASPAEPRMMTQYGADDEEHAILANDRRHSRPIEVLPTTHHNDSTTSVVTMLGHGDEPEVLALQRTLAFNGIHISERQVRGQRRALERIIRSQSLSATSRSPNATDRTATFSPIGFHLPVRRDISADEISTEYARELERHRDYRFARMRAYELQQNMTPEQRRRLQQSAQIEANMRGIGQQQQWDWSTAPNAAPQGRTGQQQQNPAQAQMIVSREGQNQRQAETFVNGQHQVAASKEEAVKQRHLHGGLEPDATKRVDQAKPSGAAESLEDKYQRALNQVARHLQVMTGMLAQVNKSRELESQLQKREQVMKATNRDLLATIAKHFRRVEWENINAMKAFRSKLGDGDVAPEFRMYVDPNTLTYGQAYQVVLKLKDGWAAIVEKLLAGQQELRVQIADMERDHLSQIAERDEQLDALEERCEMLERGGLEVNEIRLTPTPGELDVD